MAVRRERRHAAARRALQIALLDEIGLEHILDGLGILADRMREVLQTDGAAREFLDHGEEQLAVHDVEPERVDIEHLERGFGDALRDAAVGFHLGVIAHAAQQAVGDARRAARAAGDLARTFVVQWHL